ncbi:sulfite exporter TauE/SafE family protein [Geomonas sp. RF6]|uniref:sulfite exporter TauE/SafE family protein n=1 Tax=Geomonas sp. RF6 TaxID=2897342 RepID=UPI001E3DA2F8|nr:sulfite exporter TauE/SafE family protein [Geomonas sp. RF6]UFS71119.1 sulfite exporter TauE/SafE family protein [Geomonas sp. RF6]
MTVIWLSLLAGLAGSFHCIGMCGGIVAALSLRGEDSSLRHTLHRQICYHSGRVTTYTVLGAAAGWIGGSLNASVLNSASSWLFIAANLCVIAAGLGTALKLDRLNLSALEGAGGRLLARPLRRVMTSTSPLAAFPLGAILGFLPCGLVYAPLPAAAAAGTPLMGAAIMGALGLGTTPALLLCGGASFAASGAVRGAMARCAGVAVALMGSAALWRVLSRACPHCGL